MRENSSEFFLAPPEGDILISILTLSLTLTLTLTPYPDFNFVLESAIHGFEQLYDPPLNHPISGQTIGGWLEKNHMNSTKTTTERERITQTDPEDESHLASFEAGKRILFPMRTLLEAADVNLEKVCDLCKIGSAKGRTLRRVGVALTVTLTYSNMWNKTDSTGPFMYGIRSVYDEKAEGVRSMKIERRGVTTTPEGKSLDVENVDLDVDVDVDVDVNLDVEGKPLEWRVKRRSYGIKLTFRHDGMVATFSYTSLLEFVLTALTQLAVASTLAELALTIYPAKELWCAHDAAHQDQTKTESNLKGKVA